MGRETNLYKSLGLTISGIRSEMYISKNVIRVLGHPEYLCFRVNKARDSIIIFPCEVSDPMSYKVPEEIFTDAHKMMRIHSKGFVTTILHANDLSVNSTYTVYGQYFEELNLVRFHLKENFENRNFSDAK